MATFDFLASENVVDEEALSDGENDEVQTDEDGGDDRLLVKRQKVKNTGDLTGVEDMTDADTEEALAEFDFLVSTHREAGADKKDVLQGEEWGVDQQMISKLKEQYKRERHRDNKGGAGQAHLSDRPKRSTLQAMLVNLDNEDDMPALQSGSHSPPRAANNNSLTDIDDTSPRKGMIDVLGNEEDALEAALGLGELAGLTITNEADSLSYDMSSSKDMHRRTWNAKYTLRSHFDAIRALVFHPVEPVLITASEDHMLKLWNLQKTVPAKKAASLDVEPVYTFRAHEGPVLSLAMSPTGESCYSGGMDGTIRCWNIPNSNIDPYDSFDPSVLQATLAGHSDAVWGLSMHNSKMQLLSCSSDGTVKLWNPNGKTPLLHTFRVESETGVPTSVDFVQCEPSQMVVTYTSANAYIFDIEKSKPVISLDYKPTPDYASKSQINRVVCHPTLPVTITAHEDRHIRFFDNNSGKVIHSMVAHLDAVTSLAIDPSGLYLLSGSHDCSIRLWNLDSKTCVQEITSHRKKFDESIHDVAFHPSKPFIASAGADALAKVFA
jgi:striatin 1/3/4